MSFFGSGTGRHNSAAPGFSQAHDPFAGLSGGNFDDDGVDFEDTYDGLGDQLDESGDAFNDDTFGGGGAGGSGKVGTDFDFFGQTANVSDAIDEEHLRFNRQAPSARAAVAPVAAPTHTSGYYGGYAPSQPVRTGYEKYRDPEPEPDLEVDQSIWGIAPKPAAAPAPAPAPGSSRKFMTLEEVEASMARKSAAPAIETPPAARPRPEEQDFLYARPAPPSQAQQAPLTNHGHGHPPITILQRPQSLAKQPEPSPGISNARQPQPQQAPQPVQPIQILQNPNRHSGDAARLGVSGHQGHHSQGSLNRVPLIPQQPNLANISEEERAAYLELEAKRAKRNHKIHQLSRDNGLMTPQDKNFIVRIQLQQLVTATGNPSEAGSDAALSEDFYYQVLNQIRGAPRQNPNQPLNNFAQTYLHQTGNRHAMRRQGRVAENHMQRMEQQVQRAVEAAKNKPKNPQLVIAGSLGKISFSNSKTPKPLLNIKRTESSSERPGSARRPEGTLDKKTVLRNIERVYDTLLEMENQLRIQPPAVAQPDEELQAKQKEWVDEMQILHAKLWAQLKVHEPVGATTIHPFIAFLSFNKGKRAIPRVFRHITFEERTTILTIIVFYLDQLDVVRGAQVDNEQVALNAAMRENIELFSLSVMPSLFNYFSETDLGIVIGVLGLITKLNVDLVAKTRIGTSMLTLILSRAELLKQGGGGNTQLWNEW